MYKKKTKINKNKIQLIRSRLLISPYSLKPANMVFFNMKKGYPNPWNFFCYQWFYVKVHKALMYAPWLKLDYWYNRGQFDSVIIQINVTSFVNKSWKLTSIFLFNIRAIRKTRTPVFPSMFLFLHSPTRTTRSSSTSWKRLQIQ